MTDREKIQTILTEIGRQNGAVAVQTILHIMNNLLVEDQQMTIPGAVLSLKMIATYARDIEQEPDHWTYEGRFSQALFDNYYRQDHLIITTLRDVLGMLDGQYQSRFSVESARRYLRDVSKYAQMMWEELEKAR